MKKLLFNWYKLFHIYLTDYHTATENDGVQQLTWDYLGGKAYCKVFHALCPALINMQEKDQQEVTEIMDDFPHILCLFENDYIGLTSDSKYCLRGKKCRTQMLCVGESGKTDTLLLSQLSEENVPLSAVAGIRTGAQQRPQAPTMLKNPGPLRDTLIH